MWTRIFLIWFCFISPPPLDTEYAAHRLSYTKKRDSLCGPGFSAVHAGVLLNRSIYNIMCIGVSIKLLWGRFQIERWSRLIDKPIDRKESGDESNRYCNWYYSISFNRYFSSGCDQGGILFFLEYLAGFWRCGAVVSGVIPVYEASYPKRGMCGYRYDLLLEHQGTV